MNARFREEAPGLISEALSDWVQIVWDPVQDAARIVFEVNRYLRADDQYVTRMDSFEEAIEIAAADLYSRVYEIDGMMISGAHMDEYTRRVFDDLYNERSSPAEEEPPSE